MLILDALRSAKCRWLIVVSIAVWPLAAYAAAAADNPESRDEPVKECAHTASQRLAGGGFDGARAATVKPHNADACILRWQDRFSATNPMKVATLIVVPLDVELLSGATTRSVKLQARCGFNDNKLRAIELVQNDKPC